MKLVNFASLDPAITSTGRAGLQNAGALDKEIWAEFHADWEKLAVECEMLRRNLGLATPTEDEADELLMPEDYTGETRQVLAEQRIKQTFFRRAVLSGYRGRCCMSGLSEPCLLVGLIWFSRVAEKIEENLLQRQNQRNPVPEFFDEEILFEKTKLSSYLSCTNSDSVRQTVQITNFRLRPEGDPRHGVVSDCFTAESYELTVSESCNQEATGQYTSRTNNIARRFFDRNAEVNFC